MKSTFVNVPKRFILKDTEFEKFGINNIGALVLVAYMAYADCYVAFRHYFNMLVSGEDKYEEKQMMKFWSLYESDADFLHIDFRIMFFDSSFHTIYKNKPSLSLILFKTAYAVGDNTKACRGVGTNATRARKMKKVKNGAEIRYAITLKILSSK